MPDLRLIPPLPAPQAGGAQRAAADTYIALLFAAGVGAILFTVMAAAFVYGNTRRMISAGDWVDHTHEVLTSIQSTSQALERVEYNTRFFIATHQDDQLDATRSSAARLHTETQHLAALISDNPSQNANGHDLIACDADLDRELDSHGADHLDHIRANLLHCRRTVGSIGEVERRLLKERDLASEHSTFISFLTECAFGGFSLVMLIVVFGFLLREAFNRRRTDGETARINEQLALSVRVLEEGAEESALLTCSRDDLQLCVNVGQIYSSAAGFLSRLLPGSSGSLCMINHSRHMVEGVSSWGDPGVGTMEIFSPEACCGLRSGQPRWRLPGASETDCSHFVGQTPEHYLCIPMAAHGDTLGVLHLRCADPSIVGVIEKRMDGLRQLLQLTAMAVASLNLSTKLENQSIRDSLTGLFNRHFMQIALEREISRAVRRKSTLAVLMLDVDHFKRFNDTYGHEAGDNVLREIAQVFRANVRNEDIVCRYGGEEFAIILPEISPEIAYDRSQALHRAVADLSISLGGGVIGEATVSLGIALYPNDGNTAESLLRAADQALYKAKRQGRNQIFFSDMDLTALAGTA